MDEKFHPAMAAIKSGDLDGLRVLLSQDPSLAKARSSRGHPTLLQCLTLDAVKLPNQVAMAKTLIDAGAEINEPLIAAGSASNVEVAALLLDCGAAINGSGGWSPLEEALYWNSQGVIKLLVARGASIHNLRIASGLGRVNVIESFFNHDGSLKPEAGRIDWPWGGLETIEKSSANHQVKQEVLAKIAKWTHDRQSIINNAFVYACMHGHIDAAKVLLQKGAQIDAIPPGFDYSGTSLHYAALNGHRAMVEFLVSLGANVKVKDTKVGSTPAGWAKHGGHLELKDWLDDVANARPAQ